MKWWRQFAALEADDRALLLRAAASLLVARAALAMLGFGRVRRLLLRAPLRVRDAGQARERAHAIALALARAARHLPLRTTCLDRAVALWRLLAAEGVDAELRIGVRSGDALAAHAWVEHRGEALAGADPHDGFVPFDVPLLAAADRGR